MARYIWIRGKRFYYYETYDTWKKAYNIGRKHKRKYKTEYFILKYEHGFWFPKLKYKLYMNRVVRW